MDLQYNGDGIVKAAKLSEKIPLHEWIEKLVQKNKQPSEMFTFLLRAGKYFGDILTEHPRELPPPLQMRHDRCYANTLLYATSVIKEQPSLSADLKFVAGFCGMKAVDPETPLCKYFILNHGWALYKECVLDITLIKFPFIGYVVDQYFGIAFDIQVVNDAVDALFANEKKPTPAPPLFTLRNEPYIQ